MDLTVRKIVQGYKAAEDAAKWYLDSAERLDEEIGRRAATQDEVTQLGSLLEKAFKQGHEYSSFPLSLYTPDTNVASCRAEGWRGDWITSRHRPEDIKDSDPGHLTAIEWIDNNIMQPIQRIAKRRDIIIDPPSRS